MPRSSEAFSSKILERHKSPNRSLAAAKIVEVFPAISSSILLCILHSYDELEKKGIPVPGGP